MRQPFHEDRYSRYPTPRYKGEVSNVVRARKDQDLLDRLSKGKYLTPDEKDRALLVAEQRRKQNASGCKQSKSNR